MTVTGNKTTTCWCCNKNNGGNQ